MSTKTPTVEKTEIVPVDQIQKADDFKSILTGIRSIDKVSKSLSVESDDFDTVSVETGIKINDLIKVIKATQKNRVAGAKQHIKDVDSLFKPMIDHLQSQKNWLNDCQEQKRQKEIREEEKRRAALQKKQEKQMERYEKKVEKAAAEGKPVPTMAPVVKEEVQEKKTIKSDIGMAIRKEVIKWDLVDISKVPEKYLKKVIDKDLVDFDVKKKGVRSIEGLHIFTKIETSYRR